MTVAAILLAKPLALIFVGYDKVLTDMTVRGFIIYSLSFLLCGINKPTRFCLLLIRICTLSPFILVSLHLKEDLEIVIYHEE